MKAIVLFTGAFIGSFALLSSHDGEAAWIRVHATDCTIDPYYTIPLDNTWFAGSTDQGVSNGFNDGHFTETATIWCALRESSSFLKESITTLNIHGEDRTTASQAIAKACITYWGTNNGGECGTQAGSSGNYMGPYTLAPGRTKWTSVQAADFAYIWIVIPDQQGSNGPSTFRGYFAQTP